MLKTQLKSAAVAALLATAAAAPAVAQSVGIAGNVPLTGPIAAYSGNYFNGFQMGLDDTCAALEVDCSVFALDAQDNAGQPQQAVSIAQRQLMSEPSVVISGTSEVSSAIAPFFDDSDTAHFMIAFDARIVESSASRMRMLPNFKDEATQYMRLIDKLAPEKIVAMAVNGASNVEMFEDVVGQMIVDAGIDYTFLPYEFETSDYSNIALRAMQAEPDLYILSGYSFQIYGLMRALASNGVPPEKVVVTMDFVDLIYNDTPNSELAGYYFTTPKFEVPGLSENAAGFREAYEARFGAKPSYVEAYAYDTAAMVVSAYAASGEVTPATIAALSPFTGVTGTVTFDEYGDVSGAVTVATFAEDGTITEIE